MTGLILQAAARGVSLIAHARVAVDEVAIRQLSYGRRPAVETRLAWAALHPLLSLQLLRNRTDEDPMDEWIDMVDAVDECDGWDDDGEMPY